VALARLAEVFRETTRARGGSFARDLHRGGLARRLLSDERVRDSAVEVLATTARLPALEPAGLPSTTHVSVLDARGNAASLSSSTGCGSGFFVPGTGIHLNNMLGELDLNPPGAPSRPGMRLTSMMAPSILLRAGRPRLVLGSAGSERLRAAIVQTVVNVVDHGLGVAEAIDRPRVHLDGDDLHVEGGTDPAEADRLASLGYRLTRWPGEGRSLYFGGVSAVGLRGDSNLEASGDVRRGGHGVVVEDDPGRSGAA
jgi:gamma-glutamyltranspeptidase/glutathione hydrolase